MQGGALVDLFGGNRALLILAVTTACLFVVTFLLRRKPKHAHQTVSAALHPFIDQATPEIARSPPATISIAPLERWLPRRGPAVCASAAVIATATWLLGHALAPDQQKFLAAAEWRFQPVYLVAHIVALHYFVRVFARNFRAALRSIDMPTENVSVWLSQLLGLPGLLVAALVAAPFCASDYFYITTGPYERLGGARTANGADLLMWAIWCLEWFMNALIWVILLAFLYKNSSIIRRRAFVDPIEVVVLDRKYRPFLQMSAQGASVLLSFSVVTILYIAYAGGEITDYLGLTITGVLLIIGFIIPWLLLRAKVRRAIAGERFALTRVILRQRDNATALSELGGVQQRLDNALSYLRLAHLDGLHVNLGRREARAIMLRLLAPALTIAWGVFQHWGDVATKFALLLNAALASLRLILR